MQLNLNENNPFEKARNTFKKETPKPQTFEEHKANFEKSSLGRTVQKAFENVPYEVENRGIYIVSGAVSYACQLVSVTAAASFVFAFVLSRISTLPYAWYVAFGIAAATLFCIEFLLRKETPKLSRSILLNGFSLNLWRRGLFVLVLTAAGIVSSYLGGFDTAAALATDKPVFSAPAALAAPVINLEEIRERYKPQISDAKKDAKEYKARRLWKGRLSIADANKHRKMLAVATTKENELNNEIKAAIVTNTEQREKTIQENNRRETSAKTDHNELIVSYDNSINENGGGLAGLSVVAQFIFFCCLFYRSHYLIETAKQYASPTSGPAHDPSDNGGGSRAKKKRNDSLTDADIEHLLQQAENDANHDPNSRFLNTSKPAAKMRVLHGGKSDANQLQTNKADKTQTYKTAFVPSDLTIEHKDRQSGKIKRLNITQVRGNISANKTRLKKSKQDGTHQQIENIKSILIYWREKENELIEKAAQMERGKAVV